jgi:predicted membrane chloride channel (bestrophin family)
MIDYNTGDYWHRIIFRLRGSVMPKSFTFAFPSAVAALVLVIYTEDLQASREAAGIFSAKTTLIWGCLTFPLLTLLSFRTNQAWGRFWEGTGLLHAMRGEWFDSASCLATFSFPAKHSKPELVEEFRHTMLRLMSLCHGSALDELKAEQTEDYEVLDIRGLDEKTVKILFECKRNHFNRVEVVLHMVQILVINAQRQGIIDVPPPILSRVYQTLSRGFVNLLSAKKIKDTKFPFPYAQIVLALLVLLAIFTPLAMSVMLPHYVWSLLGTFFPVFGAACLHFIAQELEMPYGEDDNDLPIAHFQEEMNSSLMMLIHADADHVAKTGRKAKKEWEDIVESVHDRRNSMARLGRNLVTSGRATVFTPASEYSLNGPKNNSTIWDELEEASGAESDVCSNSDLFDEASIIKTEASAKPDPYGSTAPPTESSHQLAVVANCTGAVTPEQVKHKLTLNEEHEAMVRELMKLASPPEMNGISAPPRSERPRGDGSLYIDRCHDSRRPHTMTLHSHSSDDSCIPPEQSLPEMSRPGNSKWRRQLLSNPSPQPMQHVEQGQQSFPV